MNIIFVVHPTDSDVIADLITSWYVVQVVKFESAVLALRAIDERPTGLGLIITSLYPNDMDGFDFVEQIQEEFRLPIILLTPEIEKGHPNIKRILDLRVPNIIEPVQPAVLYREIEQVFPNLKKKDGTSTMPIPTNEAASPYITSQVLSVIASNSSHPVEDVRKCFDLLKSVDRLCGAMWIANETGIGLMTVVYEQIGRDAISDS